MIDANERLTCVHAGPSPEGWASIIECGPDEPLTTFALPGLAVKLRDID